MSNMIEKLWLQLSEGADPVAEDATWRVTVCIPRGAAMPMWTVAHKPTARTWQVFRLEEVRQILEARA